MDNQTAENQTGEYEFNQQQNEIIKALSVKMLFVGIFLIVVSLFNLVPAVLAIVGGNMNQQVLSKLITGVFYIIIGWWTINASSSFKLVVETEGSDITNLMNALGELKKLYTLQFWIVVIAIILIVLVMLFGAFAAFSMS